MTIQDEIKRIRRENYKTLFKEKGFDVDTEQGVLEANRWLKTATWNNVFFSGPMEYKPGSIDEAMDRLTGTFHLNEMKAMINELMKQRGLTE